MATWLPAPLREVAQLPITETAIRGWMELGESEHLDFKRDWWQLSDSGKKEFARDIAAFANAGGGVIVIGVAQDESFEISGIDIDFDPEEWSRNVGAARIEPPPRFSVETVDAESGPCVVMVIPPSMESPHAVWSNQQQLEYPIRHGTTKRYMSEREVARAYERRFAESTARIGDLGDLHDHCRNSLSSVIRSSEPPLDSCKAFCVITVAAAPSVRGSVELRRGVVRSFESWVRDAIRAGPAPRSRMPSGARVGFEAVIISDDPRTSFPLTYVELRTDGSGAVALAFPLKELTDTGDSGHPQWTGWDAQLFSDVYSGVHLLVEHASRSGGGGSLQVASSVSGTFGHGVGRSTGEAPRFAIRPTAVSFIPPAWDPHPETAGTPLVYRSRSLESLSTSTSEVLDLVREIVTALGSAFGIEECRQVTSDLEMNVAAFDGPNQGQVTTWAEAHGVPVSGRD